MLCRANATVEEERGSRGLLKVCQGCSRLRGDGAVMADGACVVWSKARVVVAGCGVGEPGGEGGRLGSGEGGGV